MANGSKMVSVNACAEPSCELAASSSQNSLPVGSFMEVNADMTSRSTEPPVSLLLVLLRTHCQLAALRR